MLWPLNGMLASPHGSAFSSYGLIAAGPWVVLCGKAGAALSRALFSVRNAAAAPAAGKAGSGKAGGDEADQADPGKLKTQ